MRSPLTSVPERGLVEVSKGKGTFGTQPKITQEPTETTGFVEEKLRSAPSHGNGPTNTLSLSIERRNMMYRVSRHVAAAAVVGLITTVTRWVAADIAL